VVRPYRQRARAASAQQTRRRILDAVYDSLVDTPAEEANVDEIARRAGVGRSTVYAIFGDRAGLFDAFAVDVLRRGGFDDLLAESEHPDAREATRRTIRGSVRIYSSHRGVLRSLYSLAQLDPGALGGAVSRLEAGRSHGMRELAARLGRERVLRAGVSVREAGDVLWTLTAFDTFDLLHTGRGRSASAVGRTLTRTAEATLFV
jgi:AcrR family transcriptional regulator